MPCLRALILSAALAGSVAGQVPTFRGVVPGGRLTADGVHLPPGVVRVFGDVKFREWGVIDRAYSPDGKYILTTSFDGLRIRDAETGAVVGRADDRMDFGAVLRFAPDGKSVYTSVAFTDATAATIRRHLVRYAVPGGGVVSRGVFDFQPYSENDLLPDGTVVGRVKPGGFGVYDPAARQVVRTRPVPPTGEEYYVASSPDGTRLLIGRSGRLCVIDTNTLAEVAVLPAEDYHTAAFGPAGGVYTLAHDPARKGTGVGGLLVTVWDPATAAVTRTIPVRYPNGGSNQNRLVVSPDGKTLAVDLREDGTRVMDLATGAERFTLYANAWGNNRLAFRPDGKEIAAGSVGLAFFDAGTGRRHPRSADLSDGGMGSAAGLRFSRDGATLTVLPDAHGAVIDYATATGAVAGKRAWRGAGDGGEFAGVGWSGGHERRPAAARSADGVFLARVVKDAGTPEVPNPTGYTMTLSAAGAEVKRVPGAARWYGEFVFTPGGKYVVGANGRTDIDVFDVAAGTVKRLPTDPDALTARGSSMQAGPILYPSPDGRSVAVHDVNTTSPETVGYRFGVGVFDLGTMKEIRRVRGVGHLHRAAWSPDGTRLAAVGKVDWSGAGGRVYLWDAATGKELVSFATTSDNVYDLAFSPDGGTLAFVMYDGLVGGVRLWEVGTGKLRRTLPGAGSPFVFSPDGRFLAAAGYKHLVFLWDVSSPADPAGSLDAAWQTLASDDAPAAYTAVLRLTADPAAVAFLAAKPADEVAAVADIAGLIAKLDSPNFSVRESASTELRKHAAVAEALLKKAVAESASAEVRERAGQLLKLPPPPPTAGERRAARSVEILARVGTPDAVKVLQAWSGGAAAFRRTIDSRRALAAIALRQR